MSSDAPPRPPGRLIDRRRTVTVTFDGRALPAHPGDTLASALLANGVDIVGTGPYTGRPRGVQGIGAAGASGYVQVESGPGEPMRPATAVEVHDGLRARPLAGRGDLDGATDEPVPDPSRYDQVWAHCDVLVVGAGPAGLAAARAAAGEGARVLLATEGPEAGGGLRRAPRTVEGTEGLEWARRVAAELDDHPEVRVLTRTAVTGHHPHGELVALQRRTDHLARPPSHMSRHRLWHIRARQTVLAGGAAERPIAFAGNDRPGVMSMSAALGYLWGYGALAGRRAVVFGAHDEALLAATQLADAGMRVAAAVDVRPRPSGAVAAELDSRGIDLLAGRGVTAALGDGDGRLDGVHVAPVDGSGRAAGTERPIVCDLLAVCGGFDPALALLTQAGGALRWSQRHASFLPDFAALPANVRCAGAARGTRTPDSAVTEGAAAGRAAAAAAPGTDPASALPTARPEQDGPPPDAAPLAAPGVDAGEFWLVNGPEIQESEVFVDPQRDVTLADLRAAREAGLTRIEHLKRYTTMGTGPDQARAWSVLASGVAGQVLGVSVGEMGTPRRRPPLEPVPFASLAGRDRGDFLDPLRRSPMHEWHVARGAVFEDVGQWRRARYYPHRDSEGVVEDMTSAVLRECRAAREGVAVLDASTLGKIIVEGRDAAEFLDRIYTNTVSTLAVGRCRYGVICGADGMVLDDGVTARLGPYRYLVTTTTGNAETVLAHLEEWAQTEWPGLSVHCTSVTEHWATVGVVGPSARDVVQPLVPDLDLSPEEFGFMQAREATVAGVAARILRVSFTGELTFEIYVPSWYGPGVWEAVLAAGRPYGITPYGTETMHVLRAEKGFIVVGHETDGQVAPADAGLGWALSRRKDFVGKRSLARPDTAREDRPRLVGLLPREPGAVPAEGAQLIADPDARPPVPMLGRVTSAYRSAALDGGFALALLSGGDRRHGETLYAYHLGRVVPVQVTDPVFYDPEGNRRDG